MIKKLNVLSGTGPWLYKNSWGFSSVHQDEKANVCFVIFPSPASPLTHITSQNFPSHLSVSKQKHDFGEVFFKDELGQLAAAGMFGSDEASGDFCQRATRQRFNLSTANSTDRLTHVEQRTKTKNQADTSWGFTNRHIERKLARDQDARRDTWLKAKPHWWGTVWGSTNLSPCYVQKVKLKILHQRLHVPLVDFMRQTPVQLRFICSPTSQLQLSRWTQQSTRWGKRTILVQFGRHKTTRREELETCSHIEKGLLEDKGQFVKKTQENEGLSV